SDVEFALTPPSEFRRTKLTQPGTHKDGDAAQIPTDIRLPYRLLDRTEKPLSGTVGDIIAVAVIDLVSVLRPIPGGIESAQFRKPATARAQRFKEVVHTATDTRHGAGTRYEAVHRSPSCSDDPFAVISHTCRRSPRHCCRRRRVRCSERR